MHIRIVSIDLTSDKDGKVNHLIKINLAQLAVGL